MTEESPNRTSLLELGLLFLGLGATAFGGPAAHLAMMREEVVVRRRWLSDELFLDLYAATQLIPGPNSTEMAIHIGWLRRRWAGLLIAGVAFIVPAMLLTGAIGWAYVEYGALPEVSGLLYGVKPVIVAVVAQALWSLLPKTAATWVTRTLGVAAVIAVLFGAHELGVLLGAGLLSASSRLARSNRSGALPLLPFLAAPAISAIPIALTSIFWVFLKIGSVLFGSGYVLIAFLRADLVERLHWLTEAQLIDAVAVGQVTPGPVFTTATFIGYVLSGPSGALVATVGIFLPAFVFVALSGPLVPKLRASPIAGSFLDGINVASLALMGVAMAQIARAAIVDPITTVLAIGSLLALVRFKVSSTWLVLGGALVGAAAQAIRP